MQICGWAQGGDKKFARIYRRFKFIANYYKLRQPPLATQTARGSWQIIVTIFHRHRPQSAFFIITSARLIKSICQG